MNISFKVKSQDLPSPSPKPKITLAVIRAGK